MWGSSRKAVKNLRCSSIVVGIANVMVIVIGVALIALRPRPYCKRDELFPVVLIMVLALVRMVAMVRCAIHQQAAAVAILGSSPDDTLVSQDISRLERRLRYKRWLCWTRFATVVTVLQLLLAIRLLFLVAEMTNGCIMGLLTSKNLWMSNVLISFLILVCFVATLQCFSSADVLKWRSFYEMQDFAWKAHYEEVFDHGIREAFCCLGRTNYLRAIEEDEVYSVAQLLGDLVTYRASGTGHLELLAGLALLQTHDQYPKSDESSVDAPDDEIQKAMAFHPFAEAAYTGPLLDVGRNPILFPCMWLYRQGILTAWCRNRRAVLQGDNWWRGHAAAFVKYAKIHSGCLRRGRVNQGKCQAAYFVVVEHHIRSVVIVVRGTETPEDLITDGLCREIYLTMEDLDGLINGALVDPMTRQNVRSSFPHYGHLGIVEAARELYNQLEGKKTDDSSYSGFLSSLLGEGCECEGYAVRVVGHSLGGAIAAMLGVRLHGRFPDLHVYSYGPLPCLDSVVAVACSSFITCIVHNSEFSSHLSVNSILRLRAAALTTMSQGTTVDKDMLYKMAKILLCVSKFQKRKVVKSLPETQVNNSNAAQSQRNDPLYENHQRNITASDGNIDQRKYSFLQDDESQVREICEDIIVNNMMDNLSDSLDTDKSLVNDAVSEFMDGVPSPETRSDSDLPEMFLPGLVIQLIKQHRGININLPLCNSSKGSPEKEPPPYRAIFADRENFKEILVSPYMFLDHLPWRCRSALKRVLQSRNHSTNHDKNFLIRFYQNLRASLSNASSSKTASP